MWFEPYYYKKQDDSEETVDQYETDNLQTITRLNTLIDRSKMSQTYQQWCMCLTLKHQMILKTTTTACFCNICYSECFAD